MVEGRTQKLIDTILLSAVSKKASDIHITTNCEAFFRIKGRLLREEDRKYTLEEVDQMVRELTGDKYDDFIKNKQLDIAYMIPDVARFRVNAYFQRGTISITLRIIETDPPTLDELKMPKIFKDILHHKNGLILITGATGSGKTTTLAAILNEINMTKEFKIVTLEDPIEYVFKNKKSLITQREVGTDVLSFAEGLKAMLRQDPDVVVAGELRDHETMELALTAAETGHLVLATLHTNSAISSVERVIGVFPPEQQERIKLQLSKSLIAVISQHLVPTVSGGRTVALEVLVNTKGISNLIRENKLTQIPNMMKMGRNEGMCLMNDYLDSLVQKGIIKDEVAEEYKSKQ